MNKHIIKMHGRSDLIKEMILKIDSQAKISFGDPCKCNEHEVKIKAHCIINENDELKIDKITTKPSGLLGEWFL